MLRVATIINTHGLKGECKLYIHTDQPQERFKKGNILYLQDGTELEVISYREQKGFGYCKFVGVDTIEKAEALKTKEVFIKKSDLLKSEDEYYYYELVDCKVFNEQEEYLAKSAISWKQERIWFCVFKMEKKSFLLPFVDAFLIDVDIEQKDHDQRNGRLAMKISILTLFPEYFEPLWNTSIIKRAKEKIFLNTK